jgi:hypothetical protein
MYAFNREVPWSRYGADGLQDGKKQEGDKWKDIISMNYRS